MVGGSEITSGQWGWQAGRKAGCAAGKSTGKLEPLRTKWNLHVALTTSKCRAHVTEERLVPFTAEVPVSLPQDSRNLRKQI